MREAAAAAGTEPPRAFGRCAECGVWTRHEPTGRFCEPRRGQGGACQARHRFPRHRHHPHTGHGRGAEGEFRASWRADGAGAGRLHAVDALPQLRSGEAGLAEPRPLPAVERPRLHAALCPAVPRRRRAAGSARRQARPAGRQPRRHQELSAAGQRLSGPPGIRPYDRGRDHHRPTRPRLRRLGRHGDRRALAGGPVQHAGAQAFRLRRLRHLLRRRHDGGRGERGGLDRRPSQALQPMLDLRRQHHLHRRPHRHHVLRGRGQTLPGLRLEYAPRRRRQRLRGDGPRDRECSRRLPIGRR